MAMRILSFFAVFLASMFSIFQEAGYRDLVNVVPQPRLNEPTTGSGEGGGIGGGDGALRRSAEPLQLTISEVAGSEYKNGQVLIYEVKILNAGNINITIPWATSPKDIEPARPGNYRYWMASIRPRLVPASGVESLASATLLYGSESSATMLELLPGQWIRIRAKSMLPLGNTGAMRVTAVWALDRVSFSEQNGHFNEAFVPTGPE